MDRSTQVEEPGVAHAARFSVSGNRGDGVGVVARLRDGELATVLARRSPSDRARLARSLSRTVGNRALGRVLARTVKQYQPWESPTLAAQVYNLSDRERLLRVFITMFRQIELVDATEDARKQAYDAILPAVQTAYDAIDPKTKVAAERQRRAQLKAVIDAGKAGPERIAKAVAEWEAQNVEADKLLDEVNRLDRTGEVPAWLQPLVPYFTGMKYKSAHGSWLSARHLVYVIAWVAAEDAAKAASPGVKSPKVKLDDDKLTELKGLTEADALQRLRDMRSANQIPDGAWAKVVTLSSLRLDAEGPAMGPVPDAKLEDDTWKRIISKWQAGQPPAPWIGEVGTRSWLTALKGGDIVFLQTVCNQLAEAAAAKRGIFLPSGITQNADYFYTLAGKGATVPVTPPPGKVAVAPYFRHAQGAEDFRPGTNLFFIDSPWVKEKPGAWAWVTYRSGFDYPLANDPDVTKKDAGYRNEWWKDTIPTDGAEHDGWTYNLTAGQPISRTSATAGTQWLKWLHQATVMRRLGNRVFTLETVSGGAGFRERSVDSLSTNDVFVGWLPGTDVQYEDAPAPPPGTGAANGAGAPNGAGAASDTAPAAEAAAAAASVGN
jgi:hypothetical protein